MDEQGNITVDPYYAIFPFGAELVCVTDEDSPWAIGFHGKRSSTEALVIQGHGKRVIGRHKISRRGHFSYTVAVHRQNHQRTNRTGAIFLDATCPEIIID